MAWKILPPLNITALAVLREHVCWRKQLAQMSPDKSGTLSKPTGVDYFLVVFGFSVSFSNFVMQAI